MELRQLRYFVAVAEELHFGRAADRLYISCPALSQSIRALEKELGSDLFRRAPSVALTDAGGVLLEHARTVLAQADEALAALRGQANGLRGSLVVGSAGIGAAELTTPLMRSFQDVHPGVRVSLRELGYSAQCTELLSGRVDVAFVRPPVADARLEITPLAAEPRVVALPAEHRLASARLVAVEDVLDETFVDFDRDAPRGWPEFWWLSAYRDGAPPRLSAHRARSDVETLAGVAFGDAVITAPASLARRVPFDGVAFVPLAGATPSTIAIASRGDDQRLLVSSFVRAAAKLSRDLLWLLPGSRPPVFGEAEGVAAHPGGEPDTDAPLVLSGR